jgi:hypothetical protein
MKNKSYMVGTGTVQQINSKEIFARSAREARWLYVNLYAFPGTRYSDTWCNGVQARQYRSKKAAA